MRFWWAAIETCQARDFRAHPKISFHGKGLQGLDKKIACKTFPFFRGILGYALT
jgi:hypothetical protein